MSDIRKDSKKYRQWKKEQNLKKERKRSFKRKKKRKNRNKIESSIVMKYTKEFKVPENFSILENSENVVSFFSNIISYIKKINRNKRRIKKYDILIDMSNTENITGDALMYLLTIIMNMKINKYLTIHWHGNGAKTDKANLFIKSSGFLNYLNTDKKNILTNHENIQIKSGKLIEPLIKREICDFTNEKLGTTIKYSLFLHNTLNELMLNTRDHAYNEISTFNYYWYVFVENDNEKIKYTFVDNGLGIPTTVQKKFLEKFLNNLSCDQEYKYIESALKGNFKRSQTGKNNRGKGLPEIYKYFNEDKINNLTIISNHAYYNKEKSFDLKDSLEGTLIYWEIVKNKKEDGING